MPYNGSGVFQRIYNWVNDANASVDITASRFDTEDSGFATGLSNCICKDGQTTITQNIPFNAKKITGLGAGTAATDAAQIGQSQSGQLNWVAAGGTADALTAVYSPVHTALSDGLVCYVRAGFANATTTPTFAPDGLTAHNITKNGDQAVAANDIFGAGHELILRYNLTNTVWELLNPAINVPAVTSAPALSISGQTGLLTVTGLTSTNRVKTVRDAADTILELGGSYTPTGTWTNLNLVTPALGTPSALVATNASGTAASLTAGKVSTGGSLTLGTATAFNSAATYNITGLPAGIKQITMNLSGVTMSGTCAPAFQIGDATGGLKTSGYVGGGVQTGAGTSSWAGTVGIVTSAGSATPTLVSGSVVFNLIDPVNFVWSAFVCLTNTGGYGIVGAGTVTLSGALDRITFTTVAGTATWTAGKINISYM